MAKRCSISENVKLPDFILYCRLSSAGGMPIEVLVKSPFLGLPRGIVFDPVEKTGPHFLC